jgi:hypothetical protein
MAMDRGGRTPRYWDGKAAQRVDEVLRELFEA